MRAILDRVITARASFERLTSRPGDGTGSVCIYRVSGSGCLSRFSSPMLGFGLNLPLGTDLTLAMPCEKPDILDHAKGEFMNVQQALDFLSENQPMPDHPSEALLERYRETTEVLFQFPDSGCIPLYIGSLADWDNWSIYDSIVSVLRLFPLETVVPHLLKGFESANLSQRQWTADMVRFFPDPVFLPFLEKLLQESKTETRMVAAAALERVGGSEAALIARSRLAVESDEDVIEALESLVAQEGLQ